MIQRYSSRRQQLSSSFLTQRLQNAVSYDRIAGYFNSSLLEAAGEALESVTNTVRIVCNSDLNIQDVATAKAAQFALHRSWCLSSPENDAELSKPRFARLFQLLKNEKLDVKILPDTQFGLIHGKAGVITLADGRKTSFLGSVNESYSGWRLNYELLWEDDSEEAVKWVQEEFDALWSNPYAVRLSQFVVQDIERLAKRTVIPNVELWKEAPEPAVPVIETPVYRKEYGLWEHQKYFVKKAFDAHRTRQGARYVLADQVGLGKTLQLALSAMLMALHGDRPILVIAPKTLLWQWQNEMLDLLDLPSAVWTTKGWIDENGIEHPLEVPKGILKCPRRIGLVSQGLITRGSEAAQCLRQKHYECIIVDETHRARRKNLSASQQGERPEPNNLLAFLLDIAQQSKSLLLATATPVQLYPIESWDLLNVLSKGNDHVLGNEFSLWRRRPLQGLRIVMGQASLPEDDYEYWNWLRNPLPPGQEFRDYQLLRRSLRLSDHDFVAPGDAWEQLSPADKTRARKLRTHLTRQHNPYIRHIIRRTRDYLEQTINPETNEPYLPPVNVELFGEKQEEAILLPTYLQDAYTCAEEFCRLLGERVQGAGFLKTLLLRRLGSSIYAGQKTGERILQKWQNAQLLEEEEETDEEELQAIQGQRIFHDLSDSEIQTLRRFIQTLETNQERDPKYTSIIEYLLYKGWLQRGVIIFSQYFDSVQWLADQLSIEDLPDESIGIYTGGQRSGILKNGIFYRETRDTLKRFIQKGDIRLVLGTDAASEGLNLQKLSALINLDLPWNPTRLEQRKGRIQRIGQIHDTVYIYNMRYKDSVEDRVHDILSHRLSHIYALFGQIPDYLKDVWIDTALGDIEKAKQTIDAVPEAHPFEVKYENVERIDWESCAEVLNAEERKRHLLKGW